MRRSRTFAWTLFASSSLALLTACPGGGASDEADEAGETGESGESGESGETSETSEGLDPDLPGGTPSDCDRLELLVAALEADPGAQPELVAEFVRSVSYGPEGFPIVEGTRLCMFHEDTPGQSIFVAGDFNAWAPGEHLLSEVAPGVYQGVFELPAPPTGIYKLVAGDLFFADPLARRFDWDEFGEYSQLRTIPGRSHHERWPDFDLGLGPLAPRDLTVYLPADAAAIPAGELPTLYMHDGQNLFSPQALFGGWRVSETLDEAVGMGLLDPMLVVGIDNTSARFEEYTPVTDIIDGQVVGGQADAYADFVVEGVLPFIEERYLVGETPDQRAVLGSSLGGLVSLHIGLRHREVFAAVGSMSGTIDWGSFEANNPTIRDAYAGDPPLGLRIYLDSGGDEGLGCPGDGSDNYCGNLGFADDLRGYGWTDELDLFYRWDPGAPHNELAWADRLLPALLVWGP